MTTNVEVVATKFDRKGRTIEQVQVIVNRTGDTVFLHFYNGAHHQNYSMTVEKFAKLCGLLDG